MSRFIKVAMQPNVFYTALRVAIIVGTVLALINHSSAIFSFALTKQNILQIILTYLVPYAVSTYSSVQAILQDEG